MQGVADLFEVLVAAQPAVDLAEIPGVIAVVVGLEHRGEIDGPDVQLLQMRNPLLDLLDTGNLYAVVGKRGPTEAQGVDLIKNGFVCPHIENSFTARGDTGTPMNKFWKEKAAEITGGLSTPIIPHAGKKSTS